MCLTALACSRLEAICTTQGKKLMRGDLCKGERGKKEATDSFLPHPTPSFVVLFIVCCFISQCCFITQSWNPLAFTRWPKTFSKHPLYCFSPHIITRFHWHKHSFPSGMARLWFFVSLLQANKHLCLDMLTLFFCTLLYSNWKPLSLVTLKTGFLSNELC